MRKLLITVAIFGGACKEAIVLPSADAFVQGSATKSDVSGGGETTMPVDAIADVDAGPAETTRAGLDVAAQPDVISAELDSAGGCSAAAACPTATLGACQKAACLDGTCGALPDNQGGKCDDGNPCTVEDACDTGVCVGKPKPCSNGGVCQKADGACAATPSTMILIPKGEFWMGCNGDKESFCDPDEKPQHKVALDAYYIAATEVTVAEYKKCVDSTKCDEPSTSCGANGYGTWGVVGKENYPVNCVVWDQAKTYCEFIGMRLPTEAEWERTARGGCELYSAGKCQKAEFIYPWGDALPDCEKVNRKQNTDTFCKGSELQPVGQNEKGKSPYGAYNMADNVWEWLQDWYGEDYYKDATANVAPAGAAIGTDRVQRGGAYIQNICGTQFLDEPLRTSFRCHAPPTAKNYGASYGIRCARSWAQ